jgi:hypothetical protein
MTTDTCAPDGAAATDTAAATGTTTDTASTSTETGPAASVLTDHTEPAVAGLAWSPSTRGPVAQDNLAQAAQLNPVAQDPWQILQARTTALQVSAQHNRYADQLLIDAHLYADFLLGTKPEVSGTSEVDITPPDTEAA